MAMPYRNWAKQPPEAQAATRAQAAAFLDHLDASGDAGY
jgi:deoxyribodipyrimidine photolyase-related protein